MKYQPNGLPESTLEGIFDEGQTVYSLYRTVLQLEDRIMAGTPSDPDIVSKWLASKMSPDVREQELVALTAQTMIEQGVPGVDPTMTMQQLLEVAEQYAASKSSNVFKRVPNVGIHMEGRHAKALLKESINSLYPHERGWGLTGKSVRGMAAERVHIKQSKLFLCRPDDPFEFDPDEWERGVTPMPEPSGVDTFVGHTNGPKGPQSNLTRVEYAGSPDVPPRIYFTLAVAEDFIPQADWARIWVHSQEIGLGSLRSQSQGKFKVLQFEKVFQGDGMPVKAAKAAPKKTAKSNGTSSAEELLASVSVAS